MLAAMGRITAGKTPLQIERFRQGRRTLVLMLQQLQASLHHISLREAELLAETLQPSLARIIQTDGDGAHRHKHQTY